MLEALWSIKFVANNQPGALGGGVVVIESGRILGGDASFTYVGDVRVQGAQLSAKVLVQKYDPMLHSITGLDRYTAILEGQVHKSHMTLTGYVESQPAIKLVIEMVRRAELP